MKPLSSLKQLLSLLQREEKLLTELFQKRNSLDYRYEYALELADNDAGKIATLLEYGVLRQHGPYLEIEAPFLQFFEEVLEVNETIQISLVEEMLKGIKSQMNYYLKETSAAGRHKILQKIKGSLRKTGTLALRNILDLSRNLENTYKSEPNFSIKRDKIKDLDEKRMGILALIGRTEDLISGSEESTFFSQALEEDLLQIITTLRGQLNDCRHNLIDIQRQVIEYLNRIRHQSTVVEKLKQLKYLSDQFEILPKTNIQEVLAGKGDLLFEAKSNFSTRLSLADLARNDDATDAIRKVLRRRQGGAKRVAVLAGNISKTALMAQVETEVQIDIDALVNSFLATSYSLFDFIFRRYDFPKPLTVEEGVTLFCQVVSHYESALDIRAERATEADLEYALVYPKKHTYGTAPTDR